MAEKTILEQLLERSRQTITDSLAHSELAWEFAQASQSLTEDNLRRMVAAWARSCALWNAVPNVPGNPNNPTGGTPIAPREGARLAA